MAVSTILYTQDNLEAVRHELETIGYWEGTIIADGYDDAPAQLALLDAKTNLTATFPVPPDSMVVAEILLAVYADEATDNGHSIHIATGGFRDGAGNVVLVEEVNTANNFQTYINEFQADTAAAAGDIAFTIAADTTKQGIDVSIAGVASSTNYMLGRMRLVCARKGGLWKKYSVTN